MKGKNTESFINRQLNDKQNSGKITKDTFQQLEKQFKEDKIKTFVNGKKHEGVINNIMEFITNNPRGEEVVAILEKINLSNVYPNNDLVDFCAPIFKDLFDPNRDVPDNELSTMSGIVGLLMVNSNGLKVLQEITAEKIIEGMKKNLSVTYMGIQESLNNEDDLLTDYLEDADDNEYYKNAKKNDKKTGNSNGDKKTGDGKIPDDFDDASVEDHEPEKRKCCGSGCLVM